MLLNILKYSLKNIFRNKFFSFSIIIVLTLLIFFINVLYVLDNVSIKIIWDINSKMSISLYLKENIWKNSIEVSTLKSNIEKINKNIKFDYKDKDTILREIRLKDPDAAKILENENPLPETIILSEIDLKEYVQINKIIENQLSIFVHNEEQDYFANYTTQYERINQVIYFLDSWSMWMKIVIFTFFITIVIIMYSVIWNFIYYYRNEIYITRLVWGSKKFIYWPFILQWIIYSLMSLWISLIFYFILLKNLNIVYWKDFDFWLKNNIFIIELFILVLIWATSWYMSSKKYFNRLK